MTTINIHDAKTQFSKLIARVRRGEEVVIAKSGKPVARLVPVFEAASPRKPGSAKGLLRLHENFDAALPKELIEAFEGAD